MRIRFLSFLLVFISVAAAEPAARRVVVVKVDGLSAAYLSKALIDRDPETGKPIAANIHHIFGERGVVLDNFYCRGLSLSTPAWMTLDTGLPSIVHGNVEYDRYTMRVHDYLNFFPFIIGYSRGRQTDMPGAELADDVGVKLLVDRFPYERRHQSFQLLQRGVSLTTLQRSLSKRFTSRRPRQLLDEWQAGFSMSQGLYEQLEREMIQKLDDPNIQYLDYYTGEFDHQAHLTPDPITLRATFRHTDELIGRIWRAVRASPLADRTVMVVVSDHGINTSESVYSQSYNLVRFFGSPEGGSHHVITNRHPMQQFKLRGLDPLVSKVLNRSETSKLDGKFATVLLDLDGNERASVHLRNRHLHELHFLLEALKTDKSVTGRILSVLDSQRERWRRTLGAVQNEAARLGRRVEVAAPPSRTKNGEFTDAERAKGMHLQSRRELRQLKLLEANREEYAAYAASLVRLLALDEKALRSGKFKIEELIPPGVMGEPNTPADLRDYPVEWLGAGFRTVNYLAALPALRVQNVVQEGLGSAPIDFVAMRDAAPPEGRGDVSSVLINGGAGAEARVHWRVRGDVMELRFEPRGDMRAGLPFRMIEDANLELPDGVDRKQWLTEWHTESEWLRAVHRTRYSNAIIGIADQFRRVEGTRREAVQADLLVMGNDHWNFNVRNFNPGGNHGSFLRISTHSVLMFWGGAATGFPRGKRIAEPYDALSFAPTVLELLGLPREGLPGRVMELFGK